MHGVGEHVQVFPALCALSFKMFSTAVLVLCALIGVNGRRTARYARVVSRDAEVNQTYDFIIAGGGMAGLTVAGISPPSFIFLNTR